MSNTKSRLKNIEKEVERLSPKDIDESAKFVLIGVDVSRYPGVPKGFKGNQLLEIREKDGQKETKRN